MSKNNNYYIKHEIRSNKNIIQTFLREKKNLSSYVRAVMFASYENYSNFCKIGSVKHLLVNICISKHLYGNQFECFWDSLYTKTNLHTYSYKTSGGSWVILYGVPTLTGRVRGHPPPPGKRLKSWYNFTSFYNYFYTKF